MFLLTDLAHIANEGCAAREVNSLREFEELSFGSESGGDRFALGALILVAESLIIEKHGRHLLAVEARDQFTQASGRRLFVVSGHRVRRTFERIGERISYNQSSWLIQHVEAISNFEIVFPRLWSNSSFDSALVPVHKLLH